MPLSELWELSHLAREEGRRYARRRTLFESIRNPAGRHFVGIVGPRGAGKTVLLKQLVGEFSDACYLSVDTLGETDLFETAKTLIDRYHVTHLLLDEIHFKKNFESDLKKIYDFLPVSLFFTSSVALAMAESSYDLSRRTRLVTLYPFSFREYLLFKKNAELPPLSMDDIIHKRWKSEHLQFGYAFEEYLRGGLYPFSLEEPEPLPLLKNILQKVVQRDIPLVAKLHTDEITLIEKVVEFIGRSPVEGINYTTISKNVGMTKYKAEQYVSLLQKSFILNPVFPYGTNVLKEPKVLMYLPYRLLYASWDKALGSLREDFFAESLTVSQISFSYLKSQRGMKTPDFLIRDKEGDLVLEVGGRGKGVEQFKGIHAKNKIRFVHSDETEGDRRPLFLLGYL